MVRLLFVYPDTANVRCVDLTMAIGSEIQATQIFSEFVAHNVLFMTRSTRLYDCRGQVVVVEINVCTV
jgi:hypothetical protein